MYFIVIVWHREKLLFSRQKLAYYIFKNAFNLVSYSKQVKYYLKTLKYNFYEGQKKFPRSPSLKKVALNPGITTN